jgi:hypothetical protein
MNLSGKPDAGNLLVRFDEGDHGSPWSLLYRENCSFVLLCGSPTLREIRPFFLFCLSAFSAAPREMDGRTPSENQRLAPASLNARTPETRPGNPSRKRFWFRLRAP